MKTDETSEIGSEGIEEAEPLPLPSVRGKSFVGMDFTKAKPKLAGESFEGADLTKANLSSCDLSGCDFKGALLHDADLAYANLSRARNLSARQLSGANLEGATLAETLERWPGLEQVKELSQAAAKVFITLLGVIAFTLITLASARDVAFVVDSHGTKLPLVDVEVPLRLLYLALPLLLVLLFLYFQHYLQRLWEALSQLPAIFPDGRRLDEVTYPWLLNDLCRDHLPLIRKTRAWPARIQNMISRILSGALVPLVIIYIWASGLRLHSSLVTTWHVILSTFAVAMAVWFGWILRHAFASRQLGVKGTAGLRGCVGLIPRAAVAVATFFALSYASSAYFQSNTVPQVVSTLYRTFGLRPYLDLRSADVTARPSSWKGELDDLPQVRPIILEAYDMRGADAKESFAARVTFINDNLSLSDFDSATLIGSNFTDVDARNANFSYVRFSPDRERILSSERLVLLAKALKDHYRCVWNNVQLDGASFRYARLDGVKFRDCSLRNTDFEGAYLAHAHFLETECIGTKFTSADLSGAMWRDWDLDVQHVAADFSKSRCLETDFRYADLTGANFQGAFLAGSDFSKVKRLDVEQLKVASCLCNVKLPEAWTIEHPDWIAALETFIHGAAAMQ